jgi:tetratricopeptide (TPR) repeat protein
MEFENLHPTDFSGGKMELTCRMESQQSENEILMKKSERYGKIAVAFLFLLALLWALGSYIIPILLGTVAYFAFLSLYHRPLHSKEPTWKSNRTNDFFSGTQFEQEESVAHKKRIVQITIGVAIVGVAFFFIVGIIANDSNEDSGSTNEEYSDENSEQQLDVNDRNVLTEMGNRFFDRQNYDSALFYYDKVLAIDPRNDIALYNEGLVYYKEKEYQKSIDFLKRCLSADPSNRDALYIMGHDYYDRELYNDAFNWYKQAYDAGLRDAFLSHALGYLYDSKGDIAQSIFHYKEALQQDSARTNIYSRLAELEPDKARWYKEKENQWKN